LLEILFFSFSFWELISGILSLSSYVDVTGGIFPTPQKKKKQQNKSLLVGSLFIYFYGEKKSYGSDLEFFFWVK
jgi:hypothetical protein